MLKLGYDCTVASRLLWYAVICVSTLTNEQHTLRTKIIQLSLSGTEHGALVSLYSVIYYITITIFSRASKKVQNILEALFVITSILVKGKSQTPLLLGNIFSVKNTQ